MNQRYQEVIEFASEIMGRYGISSLASLLESCRSTAAQNEISVAVVGRFKAGKSSFLNHLLDRDLLPVGVIPVTAVVTEVGYGPREKAVVHFLDGHDEEVAVETIRDFIAESENPENIKRVARVTVELPQLERMRGLRFVDTPGLESSMAHNTEASLQWLPNAGLAVVTISIDTPLSQQDIALLENLGQYTPNISILLTKADLLSEAQRFVVVSFVREQLGRAGLSPYPILLFSTRPGYEHLKAQIEEQLIQNTLAGYQKEHHAILERKIGTLLSECAEYLTLALKSAETVGSERNTLKGQVIGEREIVNDVKAEIRLVVRHATGETRARIAARLKCHQGDIEARMRESLLTDFQNWTKSLEFALKSYENWLQMSLTNELLRISGMNRTEFLSPLDKVRWHVFRRLQSFRDQLSERSERAFGVPLRTTEIELEIDEPLSPDIYIGKVFDRNWELFSVITPMWLVNWIVRRHFRSELAWMIEKNLSRLETQWTESINSALLVIQSEAERRLDELIATVVRLIDSNADEAPKIRANLERLGLAREELRAVTAQEVAQ